MKPTSKRPRKAPARKRRKTGPGRLLPDLGRLKQRAEAVTAVRTQLEHVIQDTSANWLGALRPETLRLVVGGLLTILPPEKAELTMRAEDDKDVKLDGLQLRDLGHQLLTKSLMEFAVEGIFGRTEHTVHCASCGHDKKEHRSTTVLRSECSGSAETSTFVPTSHPYRAVHVLTPPPPRRCECDRFVARRAKALSPTPRSPGT